jgi:hypothetical protein
MPGATTDLNREPFAPITVTIRDERCSMVNLDPQQHPRQK